MPNNIVSTYVKGSMQQVARDQGKSLAETWMNCKVLCLCDTSGSMNACDSRDNQKRYTVLVQELAKVQEKHPGQVAVISFSSDVVWCPNGIPVFQDMGTDVVAALKYAKPIDKEGIVIFLISDGEFYEVNEAVQLAKTFKAAINTIFVGDPNDHDAYKMLQKLAKASGGSHQNDFTVDKLSQKIEATLLLESGQKKWNNGPTVLD
jgi:hypothetical protein